MREYRDKNGHLTNGRKKLIYDPECSVCESERAESKPEASHP